MDITLKLEKEKHLSDEEMLSLLKTDEYNEALVSAADKVRKSIYSESVYI